MKETSKTENLVSSLRSESTGIFRDFDLIFSEFRLFLIEQNLKILRPLIFHQSVKKFFNDFLKVELRFIVVKLNFYIEVYSL